MASTLTKAIIGSTQSKYAAVAIFTTILIICIAFLIAENDISISKKIVSIITILLLALPGILLSLVQLTCMVTGGTLNSKTWWCGVIAWVTTLFVILYSIIIITATINSLITYKEANKKLKKYNSEKKLSNEEANDVADAIITANEEKEPVITVTSRPASVVVEPPTVPVQEPSVPVQPPTVTIVDKTGRVVSTSNIPKTEELDGGNVFGSSNNALGSGNF
tara:strand:+ start:11511 stop:12173 length:663 start_codon:yes stop_codon:yes gene_type:complete